MPSSARLLALLLLGGGLAAGTWLVLRPAGSGDAGLEAPAPAPAPGRPSEAGGRGDPPAPPAPARGPEPEEPDTNPPDWPARIFEVPAGEGALAGSALVEAVERSGDWRFVGGSAGDLEALRALSLEVPDRGTVQPYAAMLGWLKEAGFVVEARYPRLIVRRRTDDDFASR